MKKYTVLCIDKISATIHTSYFHRCMDMKYIILMKDMMLAEVIREEKEKEKR